MHEIDAKEDILARAGGEKRELSLYHDSSVGPTHLYDIYALIFFCQFHIFVYQKALIRTFHTSFLTTK